MREKKTMHRPSTVAAAALLCLSLPAMAQQAAKPAEPAKLDTVVVTGIRASLKKALDSKRDANSIMDVVTAEDVGKFPSTNVAEAITVIPGVTIDKAFGQGEKVSILGTDPALNRTLLNGQAVASADWFIADQPGRTFNYSLLAPQLVNKVEVYKSPEAWMDEGSIGGTVNIATRKPLDLKGTTVNLSGGYLYNDRIRGGEPSLSGLFGWKNDSGTFGILVSAQRSDERIRRDGIESYGTVTGDHYAKGRGGANSLTTTSTDWSTNPPTTLPPSCVGACKTTLEANLNAVAPNAISAHYFEQQRKRDTLSLAVQFKPHKQMDIEFNALDISAGYDNMSHSMFAFNGNTFNALGHLTALTVQDRVITKASFRNALTVYDLINRRAKVETDAYDLKASWKDAGWFASAHAGKSKATGGTGRQVFGEFLNKANYSYDLTGSVPKLNFSGFQTMEVEDVPVHAAPAQQGSPFADPRAFNVTGGGPSPWHTNPPNATNWRPGWGGNIVTKPTYDEEKFLQADFGLKFDGAIHQVRFGLKRREHETGQSMSGVSLAPIKGYGDVSASRFRQINLPANYLSGFGDTGDLSKRFRIDGWELASYIEGGKWLAPWQTMPTPNTFADPSFVANTWTVNEDITAAYAQADFSLESLRGNFGLRMVQTESDSKGWACTASSGQACPADRYARTSVKKKYTDLLPSVNVAYDVSDDLIVRASAAKVMARPNYGDMSSYLWIGDQTLSGGGGNPNLNPYESTNLDVSAEWYFSSNAILAGTLFHKKIDNYILVTTKKESLFNQFLGRVTEYDIARPNNAGSATVQGFSLAFQGNLGMGFGVLTNFTYADAKADTGGRLPFNSKHQLSFSPFFENDSMSARLTYSLRSKYYTQADRGNFQVTDDHDSLDASLNFKFGKQLSLGLDGMNLLDSEYRSYAEVPGVAATEKLTRGIYRTGRRYMATLRYAL